MAASSSARACCRNASSMWPFPVCSSRALLAAVPNAVLVEDRADTPDFTLVLLLLLGDDRMLWWSMDGEKEDGQEEIRKVRFSEFVKCGEKERERKERKGKLIIENKGEETNKKTKKQTV